MTHKPPRLKPCPACGAPAPVQASSCRACGDVWPRRKGGRPAPTPEEQLAARMVARAITEGHKRGPLPIVGTRNLSRKGSKVLAQIQDLAKSGNNASQIAHIIGQSVTSVRRYAKDYGVVIVKGESGPSMNGKLNAQTVERLEACRMICKKTVVVSEVAEALGVSKATAREYMKRLRDLGEIDLPEFDRRLNSGFAARKR